LLGYDRNGGIINIETEDRKKYDHILDLASQLDRRTRLELLADLAAQLDRRTRLELLADLVAQLDRRTRLELLADLDAQLRRPPATDRRKRSISELQGFFKGAWEGQDAQDYVNKERDSWAE
jgi:hypothetical protein